MKKIIYTAIIGNYDRLSPVPAGFAGSWRAVCFADCEIPETPPWKVVRISPDGLPPEALARKIKILSHEFAKDAGLSLWVDGSISIKRPLDEFVQSFPKEEAVFIRHPRRDCVYQEMDRILALKKADPEKIEAQRKDYLRNNFPAGAGLIKTGILLRKNNDAVSRLNDLWWKLTSRFETWRDQLTLPLALRILQYRALIVSDSIFRRHFFCGAHLT